MTVGRIVDLSSNNHPGTAPIDWPQVKKAGVTTVLVKATQGVGYTNPWYARDLAGALGQGMDVLAYHFAAFGTVGKEAAHFQAVAGLTRAKVLDSETSTNVAWMNDFLRALGCPPTRLLDYGSASALSGIGGQLRAMLWVAAYGQGYPGYGVMWQFTDAATIPGITGPVDESRWYGTTEQYDRLFGKFDPPPPIITEDTMQLYATNSAGTGFVIAADLSSKRGLPDAADAGALLATNQYVKVALTDQLINAIPNA